MFFNNRILWEVSLAFVTLTLDVYSKQVKEQIVAILQHVQCCFNNLQPAIQVNISNFVHINSRPVCNFY